MATDLDTHGGGASKAKVEQHEVGFLLLEQFPVGGLVLSCSNHFRLRNIRADDAQGAFEFEGHVLDDNNFK